MNHTREDWFIALVGPISIFVGMVSSCVKAPAPKPDHVTEAGLPSCESAYQHQLDASCPPEEDARGGWILNECAALSQEQRVCITEADTCAAMRGCAEASGAQ